MTQPINRDTPTQGRRSAEAIGPAGPTEPIEFLGTVPARLSRHGALGLLSTTAAGVLAGCTALPSSSRITRSGVAISDTNVLIETTPGLDERDSAEDIVNGFLRAAIAGFSDDFATAKQFLSDHTVTQRKPLETVSTYSESAEPQVLVVANGSSTVTSGQVEVLNSLGVFTPVPGGSTYTGGFSLATNPTGRWHVTGLPHGILLPLSRLMQNSTVSSLAFLPRDRSRFVPELRWYSRGSQADSLVSKLLTGPSDWLAKGASSLIPRNAERTRRGVVIEGGTATVHLNAGSNPASEDVRGLTVAQIEQSLVQISGIDHVRVLAGTVGLGAAAQLTPMAPEVGGIVGMSEGSVVRDTGARRVTLTSDRVLRTSDTCSLSLGADGAVYAPSASNLLRLLRGQDSINVTLSVGDPSADAGRLGVPISGRHDWAWLLTEGRLTAVNGSGRRATLKFSWLQDGAVAAFDLPVESERITVWRTDGWVAVAIITRDQDDRPTGLEPTLETPHVSGTGTQGLSWCTPSAVCVLAAAGTEGGSVPEVRLVQVGGAVNTLMGVHRTRSVISDRSEESLLIIDEGGQIWQRHGAMSRVLIAGVTDPSFPLPRANAPDTRLWVPPVSQNHGAPGYWGPNPHRGAGQDYSTWASRRMTPWARS